MTKEELEKATGQELIDERNYCGVDGYYGDYLDNVNAEILKRINRLAELEKENKVLAQNLEDTEICKKTLKDKVAELKHDVEIWKKANENNGYKAFRFEEENAELKEELKDANEKVVHLACNQNKDLKRKLTKAKEIISEYINILKGDTKNWKKTQEKAEQFLKEVEE